MQKIEDPAAKSANLWLCRPLELQLTGGSEVCYGMRNMNPVRNFQFYIVLVYKELNYG